MPHVYMSDDRARLEGRRPPAGPCRTAASAPSSPRPRSLAQVDPGELHGGPGLVADVQLEQHGGEGLDRARRWTARRRRGAACRAAPATISMVVCVADVWSEQMSTSLSTGWARSPSSLAGTWWKAAATRRLGHGGLHAGGHRAAGRDQRLELVADLGQGVGHEMTTLPRSCLATERGRGRGGVPRGGDDHDVGLGRALVVGRLDGQLVVRPLGSWSLSASSMARYLDREPMTTSKPPEASRAARARPAGPVPPRTPMCTAARVVTPVSRSASIAVTRHVTSAVHRPIGETVGLLDGKRVLVTGVLTEDSLAFAVADLAQREGAELVLTGAGRGLSITTAHGPQAPRRPRRARVRRHRRQPTPQAVRRRPGRQVGPGRRRAARHRLRPRVRLGGNFLRRGWDDVAVAMRISA